MAPPPPPGGRSGPAKGLVVGLVMVWLAGVVGLIGLGWWVAQPVGPDYPSAWDPRVADLVEFVESERDLDFDHPVHIDFLTDDEFRPEVTNEGSDLSRDDRASLDQGAGLLRALGLMHGELDLLGAFNQLSGEGTLAFYDPVSERIRVRGTELTVKLRGTIVHELTHALQDQHFDVQREGSFPVEGQNDTYRAVLEGDAERVQTAWVETLSEADQAAWGEEGDAQVGSMDLGGVPEVLVQMFAAPYNFGQPFIDVLVAAEGKQAVDQALSEPPRSDAYLMDPFRYLANEEPRPVDAPSLAPGEKQSDDGVFGAISLYFMLAQRLDPVRALTATDAWAGDAYVSYERDGVDCMKVNLAGRDEAGTQRMYGALQEWAKGMPAGAASVTRSGATIHLNSCDPGADAPAAAGDLGIAVAMPLIRTQIALGGLQAEVSPEEARCTAQHFVASLSPEDLLAFAAGDEPSVAVQQAGAAAGQVCLRD